MNARLIEKEFVHGFFGFDNRIFPADAVGLYEFVLMVFVERLACFAAASAVFVISYRSHVCIHYGILYIFATCEFPKMRDPGSFCKDLQRKVSPLSFGNSKT